MTMDLKMMAVEPHPIWVRTHQVLVNTESFVSGKRLF